MDDQVLGPLFQHPETVGHLWILVVVVAAASAALAALGLVRGRLSLGLGVSGLVLLPVAAFMLGNVVLMNRSKGTQFCASCHSIMSPVVKSVLTRQDSLAGVHWKAGAVSHSDGCYECHSGYGLWGGFHAKASGIRHMWHAATRTYKFPLHIYGSFDISSCLACHAESARFRAVKAHQDMGIQKALLSGEMSCAGLCHLPAHPADALNGVGGASR